MSLKFTTYFAVGRTPSSAPAFTAAGPPGPAPAKTLKVEADEGVVRGPGGPPHMPTFSMYFRDETLECDFSGDNLVVAELHVKIEESSVPSYLDVIHAWSQFEGCRRAVGLQHPI
jgi:hypothetical protein